MTRINFQWFIALLALCVAFGCSQEKAPLQQPAEPVAAPEELSKKPADAVAEHDHSAGVEGAPALPAIPAGAKVWFISPKAADKVEGPLVDGKVEVSVVMGAEGVTVQPAGEVVEGTGHHHILIDLAPIPAGTVVPKDDSHIHFGGGQTEAKIMVPPGQHTLTLQFADGMHRSYGPELSSSTTIEVVAAAAGTSP